MEINDLVKELNSLTVIDAVRLAKQLELEWGVSSAIRIQIFNPEKDKASVETQEEFDVIMVDCGTRKIEVIKALRSLLPNLGLKEARDMAETPDYTIFHGASKKVAFDTKYLLEKAGAKISVI